MPTTRSASLRVAHARSCPNASRSALDSAGDGSGCTCQPSYYTHHRDASGRPVKGPRVRDRQTAERALRKLAVAIDEGRVGVGRPDTTTTFRQWADGFEAILEGNGRRASTVRAYRPTLKYGRDVFGSLPLRAIGNDELRRFVRALRDGGNGDASVAKHLRHLSAVLSQAVEDGKLDANPVPRFKRRLELRVPRGTPSYTDEELAKLWAQMEALKYPAVYVAAFRFATVTGVRVGELIALDWQDVDLSNRLIRIRHTWDAYDGLMPPKDREERVIYLVPAAVALLERWVAIPGRPQGRPRVPEPRRGRAADGPPARQGAGAGTREGGHPESRRERQAAQAAPLAARLVRPHRPRARRRPGVRAGQPRPLHARPDRERVRPVGSGGASQDRRQRGRGRLPGLTASIVRQGRAAPGRSGHRIGKPRGPLSSEGFATLLGTSAKGLAVVVTRRAGGLLRRAVAFPGVSVRLARYAEPALFQQPH